MAATIAPGPIPFLPFTHNQILHAVNLGSLPAWFALVFLPRWRHTEKITIGVAVAYSLLYATLAYVLFSQALFSLDFAAFTTVKGLSDMLAQSTAVLAGWAHFIVFDLFTARFFVLDSFRAGRAVYFVGYVLRTRRSVDLRSGEEGARVVGVENRGSKWGCGWGQQVRPKEGMTKNARAE